MKLGSIKERQEAEYGPLVEKFINEVKGLNLNGLPEPHIPAVGDWYEKCRYKFAFCGMETNGWGDLSEFVKMSPTEIINSDNDTINNLEFLNWKQNDHATFWAFVLRFLSEFYHLPYEELCYGKHSEVLRSFLWANTNAIERYEVSAKGAGADLNAWEKVKEASLPFDNFNHIIDFAKPNVVFVLYSGVPEKFFLDMDKEYMGLEFSDRKTYLRLDNKDLKYRYYYRRDSNTHFFCLPHPTFMGLYSGKGIDVYVKNIHRDIETYHIWNFMPSDLSGKWFAPIKSADKSSMEYKREFIASLAEFLIENNSIMSGQEIQTLFNVNGIKTNWGGEYSENGGRGIHNLITQVWNYYYKREEFQTAYNIARAFVNQNGEYAYE